jgi:hypothetical protein
MEDIDNKNLRGKTAIDAAHQGIVGEDESRVDSAISEIYGVDVEEAIEIHTNYHLDRVFDALVRRAQKAGMKRQAISSKVANLDFFGPSSQVAKGKMAEAAAVDALFRQLSSIESQGKPDDRYIKFYG